MQRKHKNRESDKPCCWNCVHPFDGAPCFLPRTDKNARDLFVGYGFFCSWNCVKCYAFYSSTHSIRYRPYSEIGALAFMTSYRPSHCPSYPLPHSYDCQCLLGFKGVRLPPQREVLTVFGGDMSIDEYRKDFMIILDKQYWEKRDHQISMKYDFKVMRHVHRIENKEEKTQKQTVRTKRAIEEEKRDEPPVSFFKPLQPIMKF